MTKLRDISTISTSNTRFFYSDWREHKRGDLDMVEVGDTIAEIKTAMDTVPIDNYLTVSIYPDDDITLATTDYTFKIEDIYMVILANQTSFPGCCWMWVMHNETRYDRYLIDMDSLNAFMELIVESNIKYGLLYNWYAVDDARGLAPAGWHVPTNTEFTTLQTFLGGNIVAGGTLKESGTIHWDAPNTGADNSSGFTMLGGGLRDGGGFYDWKGSFGYLFGSTEEEAPFVTYVDFSWSNTVFGVNSIGSKSLGYNVRCIRDTSVGWMSGERIVDYDGNVYDTVQIGTQIWMVQNLAVTHYNDGTAIPEVTGAAAWAALTTGALCAYNNDWSNVFI